MLLSLNMTLISLMASMLLPVEYTEERCLLAVLLSQVSPHFPILWAARPPSPLLSISEEQWGTCWQHGTGHWWNGGTAGKQDCQSPKCQGKESSVTKWSYPLSAFSGLSGHFLLFVLRAVSTWFYLTKALGCNLLPWRHHHIDTWMPDQELCWQLAINSRHPSSTA